MRIILSLIFFLRIACFLNAYNMDAYIFFYASKLYALRIFFLRIFFSTH